MLHRSMTCAGAPPGTGGGGGWSAEVAEKRAEGMGLALEKYNVKLKGQHVGTPTATVRVGPGQVHNPIYTAVGV